MRVLLVAAVVIIPAAARIPSAQLTNISRPAAAGFQVGDRYELVITGAAAQPVSLRITRQGRTDWGPVIGWTDAAGRWLAAGRFEKADFGGWSEVWTVGGKQVEPAIRFSVEAPCRPGGKGQAVQMGIHTSVTCETAEGMQTFATPSDPDSFRTPDGRVIPGRTPETQTAEQYHADTVTYFITSREPVRSVVRLGDEAGDLILKTIGANALNEEETRNVLSIVRAAFEWPERIPQAAKDPSRTALLLRKLDELTDQSGLKQEIAQTLVYVQAQARF